MPDTPSSSTILPSLEELYMEDLKFELMVSAIRIFRMPKLDTLCINTTNSSGLDEPLTLDYPSLRSFSVTGVTVHNAELVQAVLRGAQDLERLAVAFLGPSLSIEQLLFAAKGDSGVIQLCPRLQRLYTNLLSEDCDEISSLFPDLQIYPDFHLDSSGRNLFNDETQYDRPDLI